MLEAVASQDFWIWHAFFWLSGANNDLNILYHSNLFDEVLDNVAPDCPFTVNGHTYKRGYYLPDGIYPTWAAFVKSYTIARTAPDLNFKRAQDIKWASGVLQGRWGIIAQPTYGYVKNHKKTVKTGKHRHGKRKSMQEPEAKVKKSYLGQQKSTT
ncbi:ALP1-like protein [Tanacetum coccineum]|uniref:ALP1-like protein n=1 Tax=Tanacetum coccineum TaxID=301880 RepID=A0ABQ5DY60_9ASTR